MTPSRLERVPVSATVGLLMLRLGVLEWDAIWPGWTRWPLIALGVGGIAGVVSWMGRRANAQDK